MDLEAVKYAQVRRSLVDSRGVDVGQFVRTLTPRYGVVWRDIALGYVCIALTAALVALAPGHGVPVALAVVVGALLFGFFIAYVQLFLHEGAHYNLAAQKATSDRLCDLFVGWMVGTRVRDYRPVHFQHHRALGTVEESERSYFQPLNLTYLVTSLTGVKAVQTLLLRRRLAQKREAAAPAARGFPTMALAGAGVHLLILLVFSMSGHWPVALAWLIGMAVVFPFFGAVRQLLEHRRADADDSIDYTRVEHGAYTRMFGGGPLANFLGGAGFNRHLLHHWEPQVSYTNLAELETFLLQTQLRTVIDGRRSTYGRAFLELFHAR